MARTLENMDDTLIGVRLLPSLPASSNPGPQCATRGPAIMSCEAQFTVDACRQIELPANDRRCRQLWRSARANLTATLANFRCRGYAGVGHSHPPIEERRTLETAAAGLRRIAAFEGEALTGVCSLSAGPTRPPARFSPLARRARRGQSAERSPSRGGPASIRRAQLCRAVSGGERLKAGTNCGSCRSDCSTDR